VRIGTRASPLALAQSGTVAALLGPDAQLVRITTSGDRASAARAPGRAPGPQDKERWVKELELALLAGEIDLAVHSAKDVPSELPEGLEIVGAPRRGDPYDALVGAGSLSELEAGARVGTSSPRRAAQLRALREDLEIAVVHGNVGTRLRRLADGDLDALVLAAAGLIRLDRATEIGCLLTELVPAAGQGTLALEGRVDDEFARAAARSITDGETWQALCAERALVAGLGASCHTPLGAHATIGSGAIVLRTFVGLPDGSQWLRDSSPPAVSSCTFDDDAKAADARAAGELAAQRLLATGAAELLRLAEELGRNEASRPDDGTSQAAGPPSARPR